MLQLLQIESNVKENILLWNSDNLHKVEMFNLTIILHAINYK